MEKAVKTITHEEEVEGVFITQKEFFKLSGDVCTDILKSIAEDDASFVDVMCDAAFASKLTVGIAHAIFGEIDKACVKDVVDFHKEEEE